MNNTDKAEEYHVKNGDHEKTVIMKLPKTYEEQVEIIKEKGFIVDDDKVCKDFLKQANYYRLSAYFLPFRKADVTYFENINFVSDQYSNARLVKPVYRAVVPVTFWFFSIGYS